MPTFGEDARRLAVDMGVKLDDTQHIEWFDRELSRGAKWFIVRDGSGPINNLPRVIQNAYREENKDKAANCAGAWRSFRSALWHLDNTGRVTLVEWEKHIVTYADKVNGLRQVIVQMASEADSESRTRLMREALQQFNV